MEICVKEICASSNIIQVMLLKILMMRKKMIPKTKRFPTHPRNDKMFRESAWDRLKIKETCPE
jgi:hypothetical protein